MHLIQIQDSSTPKQLDVRAVAPRDRHPLIFSTFEALNPGESFVLVNDHDPKPLYYQFRAEQPGQVSWTYLEEGPETWRVRIGRRVDLEHTPILELIAADADLKPILDSYGLDTCC